MGGQPTALTHQTVRVTAPLFAPQMMFLTLGNDQLNEQFFNTFITILYMFQAISCSSSGGEIVLTQHLVSPLSVGDRPVHRWRKKQLFLSQPVHRTVIY